MEGLMNLPLKTLKSSKNSKMLRNCLVLNMETIRSEELILKEKNLEEQVVLISLDSQKLRLVKTKSPFLFNQNLMQQM